MNEVFECEKPDLLIETGNRFFALLPPPDRRIPLATNSPLLAAAQRHYEA
jgi:hypothetical protein